MQDVSGLVYNILLAVAIVLAVIIGAMLGIKFMVGGADEKAMIKETLAPYIIGCIVVFGAFTIWTMAINIGNSMENRDNRPSQGPLQPDGDVMF